MNRDPKKEKILTKGSQPPFDGDSKEPEDPQIQDDAHDDPSIDDEEDPFDDGRRFPSWLAD